MRFSWDGATASPGNVINVFHYMAPGVTFSDVISAIGQSQGNRKARGVRGSDCPPSPKFYTVSIYSVTEEINE